VRWGWRAADALADPPDVGDVVGAGEEVTAAVSIRSSVGTIASLRYQQYSPAEIGSVISA
jgi:hypothetical protein